MPVIVMKESAEVLQSIRPGALLIAGISRRLLRIGKVCLYVE
jgi:hypothetical protein